MPTDGPVRVMVPCTPGQKKLPPSSNTRHGLYRYGYIVGQTLGSGAYAKVKTAYSLKKKMNVAVKIINKKNAPKDVITKFLPREVQILQEVNHANIVDFYEVITTDHTEYLVMELADRGDLLDYINCRKYLSEPTTHAFFTDLVQGMSKCHSMGVVHRDLKCENLLLDSQLRLKISDFGFARQHESKQLETYCGSFAYAAPEVILGEPYNGEYADVWSMGVILYAMIVGRLPFRDTDVKTLLSEISSKLTFPSRVSPQCQDIIAKILTFSAPCRLSLEDMKVHPWMATKVVRPIATTKVSAARIVQCDPKKTAASPPQKSAAVKPAPIPEKEKETASDKDSK